ncbi:MAG: SGNH/GDSL hydrolase family protein, partial [Planctomycetota bacterium]
WPPHYRIVYRADPAVMPGASGPAHIRANAQGLRADPLPAGDAVRILVLGGSTTECLYLDHDEAWPHRLQTLLARRTGRAVWVGNAGRSGHTTREHVLQAHHLLAQVPDVDLLLVLAGMNDFMLRLRQDTQYETADLDDPAVRARLLPRAFAVTPGEGWGLRQWALVRFVRRNRYLYAARARFGAVQDEAGAVYRRWRAHRRAAGELRTALPPLDDSLDEYAANLARIAATARTHGTAVVFLTQPSIWKEVMPQEEEALLWSGGVGPFMETPGQPYYAPGTLADGLAQYNDRLRTVAAASGARIIDLVDALPRDTTVFYDDVHFNEAGAARVAEHLADALADAPPFGQPQDNP